MPKICKAESCHRLVKSKGLCEAHATRLRRHGSIREEIPIGRNHGHKKNVTPTYRSWLMMRNRCNNLNAIDFSYYGGKGIKVCKRWDSYLNFLADMGERPSIAYTLDRIDCSKGYEPSNCQWATRKTQSQKRKYCKLNKESAEEIRKLYATGNFNRYDLAKKFKISLSAFHDVIARRTWS